MVKATEAVAASTTMGLAIQRDMRKYVRNMSKKRPIDSLFPGLRGEILSATFSQAERWWYLSELAQYLNTAPSSLQRELHSLVESGILRQRRDGNRVYVQAESDAPFSVELRGLMSKLSGIADAIKGAITPFKERIQIALIYGSVARKEEHALSDVDLIFIGSVGLAELSPAIRQLEKQFQREINFNCYSTAELRRKTNARNHFLTSVLKAEKIFIKGNENELAKLAGQSDRAAA